MTTSTIIKDTHFREIDDVRRDSKNRVVLGNKTGSRASMYRIYENGIGQIILDPLETIPAHEAWVFKNEKARKSIRAGLADAKSGRLVKAREDYSKYTKGSE